MEAAGSFRELFGRPVRPGGGQRAEAEGGPPPVLTLSVPEGTTVEGLVRRLAEDYPAFGAVAYEKGRFAGAFQIVIGDRLLELAGGWQRVLVENDNVVLLPPFEGG